MEGQTLQDFHVASRCNEYLVQIITVMDSDYELQETVDITIGAHRDDEIRNPATATAVIDDMTGDLDVNRLNENVEDTPGASINLKDDNDNNIHQDHLDVLRIYRITISSQLTSVASEKCKHYAPWFRIPNDLFVMSIHISC